MAFSSEPRRTKAYSADLRWKVVWQGEILRFTHTKIAENLNVDRSTVSRILNLFQQTGGVSKKAYCKDSLTFKKITTPAQILILKLVVSKPGIFLKEIRRELLQTLMIEVDTSTICRFLHNNGFSYQKMVQTAIQRDDFFRERYVMDVSLYKREMLIFLDETGADERNCLRQFGYSLRGIPVKKHAMFVRGQRISAIAIMSIKGILDVFVTSDTVNGETFYEFTEKHLIPQLQPFDGINPNSVVIMDNCTVHHVPEIVEMIEDVGAIVHFLPPYSPDYNPIELAFSKVKGAMQELEESMTSCDTETIMLAAFASISEQDSQDWVSHCGY